MTKTLSMTVEKVRERVKDIRESKDDYEHAHGMEDSLWEDVLRAISLGAHDCPASNLAREALVSKKIEFARYTA